MFCASQAPFVLDNAFVATALCSAFVLLLFTLSILLKGAEHAIFSTKAPNYDEIYFVLRLSTKHIGEVPF